MNPEGFQVDPDPRCVCGPLYSYGGHTEPGQFSPDCPVHGTQEWVPARRLAVAGVIRKGPFDPPNTRALAVVVDWNHPRGPVAGKIVWSVEADAMAQPGTTPMRAHAMDELFRDLDRHLETGQ